MGRKPRRVVGLIHDLRGAGGSWNMSPQSFQVYMLCPECMIPTRITGKIRSTGDVVGEVRCYAKDHKSINVGEAVQLPDGDIMVTRIRHQKIPSCSFSSYIRLLDWPGFTIKARDD